MPNLLCVHKINNAFISNTNGLNTLLPQQIENYVAQQALILDYLRKAKAQATLVLSDNFLDYNSHTIN